MTTSMGPPPPKDPNPSTTGPQIEPTSPPLPPSMAAEESARPTESSNTALMGPPPLKNLDLSQPNSLLSNSHTSQKLQLQQPEHPNSDSTEATDKAHQNTKPDKIVQPSSNQYHVPYQIPPWSGPPCHKFYFEVLKDGSIIDKLDVYEKGAYMFGHVDLCDFKLDHSSISRFHAVVQFKRSGSAYLYDLGSTHGTYINKNQVDKNVYIELHVGDVIRFGHSSRLYILNGPAELMPPEANLKIMRDVRMHEEMLDREASLQRAKTEASFADGISWGMGEDAVEEYEDDGDELTWQTYKGQLTEKQEKTREKIIKRMEKIANMKKEINAIRSKDIAQGGLTQGQQTQIARNEQRMNQILEELENLEETLNDSIRESIGARTGKTSYGKKKGWMEQDEEYVSDDDEFYDRTKKKTALQKASDNKSVETAETLLEKREVLTKEINEMRELLLVERNKAVSENKPEAEAGDSLDAYMSGLSSQLVLDKAEQLQKELSVLQSELDRVDYLLKIADPTGEAAKKRELKILEPKLKKPELPAAVIDKSSIGKTKSVTKHQKEATTFTKEKNVDGTDKLKEPEASYSTKEAKTVYTVTKPQWLGAVEDLVTDETQQAAAPVVEEMKESEEFIDYKDRNKISELGDDLNSTSVSGIESGGLILRKRKENDVSQGTSNDSSEQSTSTSAELKVEDAVALLLKHQKGYYDITDEEDYGKHDISMVHRSTKDIKKPRRVLGPEKPSFLNENPEYETWVPPQGQSGDGRTSLNDKYGY